MFQGLRRLEQQDTAFRIGQDHAPAFGTLDDLAEIEKRVETEQAELEAAAAVLGAVTGALIAAGLGQQRHDLAREGDRRLRFRSLHLDRHRRGLAVRFNLDFGLSVADRANDTARIDTGDIGGAARVLDGSAQVPAPAVGILAEDSEALLVARPVEIHLRRMNDQRFQGCLRRLGLGHRLPVRLRGVQWAGKREGDGQQANSGATEHGISPRKAAGQHRGW